MSRVTAKKKWPTKQKESIKQLASEVLSADTLDFIASYIDRNVTSAKVVPLRRTEKAAKKKAA